MARILIVDDEADVRVVLCTILEAEGFDVEDAADGAQALAACKARRPDLIVTDLLMPVMDGLDFLVEAQKACPGVRAIALTGGGVRGRPGDIELLLQAASRYGAVELLMKPVRAEVLLEAVQRQLGLCPKG